MLTSGGVTFRLDKLEGMGLIRRVPSKEDRRAVHAELTAEGLALIEEVIGSHLSTEASLLEGLSQEQVDQLIVLLRALEDSVSRAPLNGEETRGALGAQ